MVVQHCSVSCVKQDNESLQVFLRVGIDNFSHVFCCFLDLIGGSLWNIDTSDVFFSKVEVFQQFVEISLVSENPRQVDVNRLKDMLAVLNEFDLLPLSIDLLGYHLNLLAVTILLASDDKLDALVEFVLLKLSLEFSNLFRRRLDH